MKEPAALESLYLFWSVALSSTAFTYQYEYAYGCVKASLGDLLKATPANV